MQPTTLRVLVGVLGALTLTGCIPAGINSPVQSSGATGVAFPDVVGIDLEGDQVSLPGGFAGRRNLVAVAFERDQQAVVDTWITAVEPLLARDRDLRLYEVPTIYESSALFRLWINNGMRAGIPDPAARRRTVTVYLDRKRFTAALAIPDTRDVHLLLLEADGRIVWRTTGPADDEKLAALADALEVNGRTRQTYTNTGKRANPRS
jgi:hypothetical protein